MKRTIVIGDIHGGLKAVKEVFKKATITINDKLIFLGDYVDGWSESAAAMDYMIELSNSHECIFIKGNHVSLIPSVQTAIVFIRVRSENCKASRNCGICS